MLTRLARVCQQSCAGAAWLIVYGVAVVLSAFDCVRPRPRRTLADDIWSTEALFLPVIEVDEPGPLNLLRPGRVAASLGLIGVLSLSVAGALWRESAPAEAPAATVTLTDGQSMLGVAAAWAPLIPMDPLVSEASSAFDASATPVASALPAANVEPAPVEAAAAHETPARASAEPAPSSTPAPSADAAPAAPSAPTGQLTRVQMHSAALAAGWPETEIEELLSVAWCESRFHVDANGWGALGLMQIMPEWFESLGIEVALAFDAATNLKVAHYIHQNDLRNGYDEWASWTCKPAGLPDNAP